MPNQIVPLWENGQVAVIIEYVKANSSNLCPEAKDNPVPFQQTVVPNNAWFLLPVGGSLKPIRQQSNYALVK